MIYHCNNDFITCFMMFRHNKKPYVWLIIHFIFLSLSAYFFFDAINPELSSEIPQSVIYVEVNILFTLTGVTGIYLNIVFIRAEISYKKKRENQRIEEQPNKSYFEKRKEEKERIERGKVKLILGASTDNEGN